MKNWWERRESPTRDFIERYSDEIAGILELFYVIFMGAFILFGFYVMVLFLFSF